MADGLLNNALTKFLMNSTVVAVASSDWLSKLKLLAHDFTDPSDPEKVKQINNLVSGLAIAGRLLPGPRTMAFIRCSYVNGMSLPNQFKVLRL